MSCQDYHRSTCKWDLSTAVLRRTGRIGKIDVDYQIEGRAVLMPNSCAAKFISHRSGQILELDHEIDLVYAQTRASDQAGAKTCCSSR